MAQADRAIDWTRDGVASVLRKIRSGDGNPGVKSRLRGRAVYLYDAHEAPGLGGAPGEIVATSGPALAVAAADGAVWIGRLRDPASEHPFKLPATQVLGAIADMPEVPLDSRGGYCEIAYEERGGAGFLHFAFYNGAMGTAACQRLLAAFRAALQRPTRVLVLMGGPDFWSNGMDLNLIEAAASPADESWHNINAIDDLAEAILRVEDRLVVAALQGNAGAGGVFFARAASEVWLRDGLVLSPHYKDMGNLYGSEFWTYSLPRYACAGAAASIMARRLPMGAAEAVRIGLADQRFGRTAAEFASEAISRAVALAASPDLSARIAALRGRRAADEAAKPLAAYREEELARMRLNFYGFDPSYHVARYKFVRKAVKSRTPVTIARHRDRRLKT
jgi:putative two-component system hydrogenase maturation factor HypX/HoxX